jgi:hypothetical protein
MLNYKEVNYEELKLRTGGSEFAGYFATSYNRASLALQCQSMRGNLDHAGEVSHIKQLTQQIFQSVIPAKFAL